MIVIFRRFIRFQLIFFLLFKHIILGFADDLNIIGNDEESISQNTSTFINEAKAIGLTVNDNKTKEWRYFQVTTMSTMQ